MILLHLKKYNNIGITILLGALFLFTSCQSSEYDRTVKEELAKGINIDTLKYGLAFGDTHKQFFDKCTVLNKKQLITQGDRGMMAVHQIYDKDGSGHMKYYFFGKFAKDEDVMFGLDMEFSYNGWSPWTEQYTAENLLLEVMDTLKKWYPGNDFKKIDNEKLNEPVYYKIDGNRQILLHTKSNRDVVGVVEDLNYK